jgi:hypothetical protein
MALQVNYNSFSVINAGNNSQFALQFIFNHFSPLIICAYSPIVIPKQRNWMHTYKTAKFFFKNWSIHVRSDLVGQESKAECYFRHKLPLYNVTKKCTYKIVLPHLANQNHNVNTCELLWFWFFIIAIKRNN